MAVIVANLVKHDRHSRATQTQRIEGITSSDVGKIKNVPKGAAIKAYPTAAGTATVYSTQTPHPTSEDDDTAAKLAGTGNVAEWDAWGAGAVTASTTQGTLLPVEVVAIAPASGTWTLEVTA